MACSDDDLGHVEFLVDEETGGRVELSAATPGVVGFVDRYRPVAELVAVAGAAGSVAGVFLPQLVFGFGQRARWEVDGFGRYRVVVSDPGEQLVGHGPRLGVVSLIAGVLLLAAVCVNRFGPWRTRAVSVALAGVLAGAIACRFLDAAGWPHSSWLVGLWLSGASALCAVVGTLAARVGRSVAEPSPESPSDTQLGADAPK